MAIGERIRFIRNLCGMTQKWLGQAVGFPPKSADVRLSQYESGVREPKEDMIKALANALGVSPMALDIPDIDTNLGLIHTLFAIEDIYGAKVTKRDNKISIVFDGSDPASDSSVFRMLSAWANQSEKLRRDKIDRDEYDEWRYTFPAKDTSQIWREVFSQKLSDGLMDVLDSEQK